MKQQPIDRFAAQVPAARQAAVYDGTKSGYDARLRALTAAYRDPDALRRLAGEIKQHTLDNLDDYLPQTIARLERNGVRVHRAADAAEARAHILRIMRENNASKMVKAKTMLSEEIALAPFLENEGMECLETDLGEFIVQLDHDHPSHIVKPIIHKNRREIAATFEKNGLGSFDEDPAAITRRAREFLRNKYREADVALTGANFISAESGRIVLVTNEGNSRFCLAANRIHIALVGIEKIVPRDRDLSVFLNLLARSATGQQLTSYTEFINGPKSPEQPDGPEQMHVVFVDNGRSEILAGKFRPILRCIRCAACLNVCPVYRQAGGHAYRATYPGPVGSVLTPLLAGKNFPDFADLPKACTLCGACNEVCPSNIPIPDMLLRLRDRGKRGKCKNALAATPPMGAFAELASHPTLWKAAMKAGALAPFIPTGLMPAPAKTWIDTRGLPEWRGGKFRQWLKTRDKPPSHSDEGGARSPSAPGLCRENLSAVLSAESPEHCGVTRPAVQSGDKLPHSTPNPDIVTSIAFDRSADLWESFSKNLLAAHGLPLGGDPGVLAAWLRENKFTHGYCDPALLPQFAAPLAAAGIVVETDFDATRIDDYTFGITRAAGAIAESGTLIFSDAATSRRLAALTPWVHIAVLARGQIHATISDALAALPDDPNIIWATGPSRTADVEGILIEGVHGPGQQIAFLANESTSAQA